MALRKLFPWLQQRALPISGIAQEYLHEAERFRFILDCERKRAERSGSKFSLIVLKKSAPCEGAPALERLAVLLKKRLRTTDEAGFLDDQRIGIRLPMTVRTTRHGCRSRSFQASICR